MCKSEKLSEDTAANDLLPISDQECKLLIALRQIDYGEMRIVIKGAEIVHVEEKKSIKL